MIVLMISSQLLLAGFVSYWLINQYKQERKQLSNQLNHEFLSVCDRQVDSLLMKHLITPSLNDSLMVRLNLTDIRTMESVSDSVHTSVVIKHLDNDRTSTPEIFAIHAEKLQELDSMEKDSIRILKSTGEERLVRSVQLFINETDEAFRTNAGAHVFSMRIDSAALLQMLSESFEEKDWDFKMAWLQSDPQEVEIGRAHGIVLADSPHMELPALQVQQIAPHLLKLLLPQFIFALILLSLSASALIFVYRSLKKQLVLNKIRNDFISNISHELKTPVSTVKVALEALRTFDLKNDPKVSGEYLEMASREVDRLEGLVGKVLNHQVLEDPEALLKKEPCNLQKLVHKTVGAMEILIREKEAGVDVQEADVPCTVMADPVYLEGVIINLIDNSLKYAGPKPEIQIIIDCKPGHIQLKVLDNGPGIPEEFKHQIFDKFFRIPTGDHHNVKGYGLGLNFAAQVMAQLGGSISFKNLPGKGCEFVLSFPKE